VIVRVGDVPVKDIREFTAELSRQPDQPLQITVRRASDRATQKVADGASPAEARELTFELPAQSLRQFGLVMKMGPIAGVQAGSPALEAGLAAGDVIETVDGEPVTSGDRAPDRLPDYFRVAAAEGRTVELGVVRKVNGDEEPQRETLHLTPRIPSTSPPGLPEGVPMAVPGAGFAYHIENEVVAVEPDGPADGGEIAAGDVITAANIVFPANDKGKQPKPLPVALGAEKRAWPALLEFVQFLPTGTMVEFTIQRGADKDAEERTVTITPAPAGDAFVAARGFVFEPIWRTRTAATFADQIRYGWNETVESLTMVVRFLQKLGTQVPLNMLGGPGTIAAAAGGAASQGVSSLLIFLTMLSANLAVINFLPIPLLDGGHMVFLAYEGLRGRPANERIVVALHMLGFAFIVSLMLFVIGLDIQRWVL
jgi:regulator of sigma E protease